MKSFSIGTILLSAFVLTSPASLFGRGDSKVFTSSHSAALKPADRCRAIGARSGGMIYVTTAKRAPNTANSDVGLRRNPGDSAFRK